MDDLSVKELEKIIEEKRKTAKTTKRKKRKLKFGKKILVVAFLICTILILFTMAMIYMGRDTTSLTILATAGVGMLPVMYGIYDFFNTQINLKHMDKNYIPNYDDERGIY